MTDWTIRRPVDIGEEFSKTMTLITDPASDRYLNEYSKLAASLKKGTENSPETTGNQTT